MLKIQEKDKFNLDLIELAWEKLEELKKSPQKILIINTNFMVSGQYISFGLDEKGHRHLLIPNINNEDIIDKLSQGVHLTIDKFTDSRGVDILYLDLICLIGPLKNLFSIIVMQILTGIFENLTENPGLICRHILDNWRAFLSQIQIRKLAASKIIGLFGELYLLEKLLKKNRDAIKFWVGPEGKEHDFKNTHDAVEVKTTKNLEKEIVIHGLSQLELPIDGTLYMYVLIYREFLEGISIIELIEKIKKFVPLTVLINYLGEFRSIFDDVDYYKEIKFKVNSEIFYEIDNDFPKLVNTSFITPIHPKVIKIQYNIDISNQPPTPLTKTKFADIIDNFANDRKN